MALHDTHTTLPLPSFDKPVKLLIVQSPYYTDIADALLQGATATLEEAGASWEVVQVPGALEIPGAMATAHRLSNFDGYIALGCVIRGETTHYENVSFDSSRGLMLLSLQGCAVGNGILTVENHDQAAVRADPTGQNKGGGAAAAALHQIALGRQWGKPKGGLGFKPITEEIQLAGDPQTSTTA